MKSNCIFAMNMSYQTDYGVVDYLTRRIKYYKKKRGSVRKLVDSKYLIQQYGKKQLKELVATRLVQIEDRIKEYEAAIKTLSNVNRKHKKA